MNKFVKKFRKSADKGTKVFDMEILSHFAIKSKVLS